MTIDATDWLGETPPATVIKNRGGRPVKGKAPVCRWRKLECDACGFIAQASRSALQRSGFPSCGCGERLHLANLRDRAAVEWDALVAELETYGPDAYRAAMHELGETPETETRDKDGLLVDKARKGGAAVKRCHFPGCTVLARNHYCPTHSDHDNRPAMGAYLKGR